MFPFISKVVPIQRNNIDTDMIISVDYLKTTAKKGLGKYIFMRAREIEENFPLNLPKYRDAQILLTGSNFGCGSSREHAAWALNDWGFKVVIAPSFSDIFYSNALNNEILPVVLPENIVKDLFHEEKEVFPYEISVDLSSQTVLTKNKKYKFEIDSYRKECFLKGIDDLGYLLEFLPDIKAFNKKRTYYFSVQEAMNKR